MGLVKQPNPSQRSPFSLEDYLADYGVGGTTLGGGGSTLNHELGSLLFPESVTQQEYNLPGHNYAGPGTRVRARIINGDKPVNTLDAASLVHDVEYLSGLYTDADSNMVTNLAASKSGFTVPTYLALKTKDMIGYTPEANLRDYKLAKDLVLSKGLLDGYPDIIFNPEIELTANVQLQSQGAKVGEAP